jgi:predicted RND superfamily exporter protein
MSLGVVAFLPVLLGVGSDFMIYLLTSVSRRLVIGAALATSASFAALAVTPISAVRQLGWTLAVGVLVTLVVSLLATRLLGAQAADDTADVRASPGRAPARTRAAVGVAAGLVALAGWALLPKLPLDADFQSLAQNLPAYDDARHVQEVMGSSGEVAIALSGPDVVTSQTLAWMRKAEAAVIVDHGDDLKPILSPRCC